MYSWVSKCCPTTPHNVGFLLRKLGHELTGFQISKLIHIHTTREVHIQTARIAGYQPGRQQGKLPGSHLVDTNRESCVRPRNTLYQLVTRDAFQLTRFLHWKLSTVNLVMKRRERHVCSNDQTTQRKRACNRRNTERRKKR